MKYLKLAAAILFVAFFAAALAAPLGPVPGLLIGGSASKIPAAWGDTREIHEIHLQVGDGPIGRTVIIWMVQIDGDLYVVGDKSSGWVGAIGNGSAVRMKMEDKLYELNAILVTQGQADVLKAWKEKYETDYPQVIQDFPPPEEALATAAVYRLTARG